MRRALDSSARLTLAAPDAKRYQMPAGVPVNQV
jgi:hypothetical protein